MDKKEWLLNQYRNEPQADEEVLRFIANFVFHENSKNGKGMEAIKNLFSEDYCWHFAHMLKTVDILHRKWTSFCMERHKNNRHHAI